MTSDEELTRYYSSSGAPQQLNTVNSIDLIRLTTLTDNAQHIVLSTKHKRIQQLTLMTAENDVAKSTMLLTWVDQVALHILRDKRTAGKTFGMFKCTRVFIVVSLIELHAFRWVLIAVAPALCVAL